MRLRALPALALAVALALAGPALAKNDDGGSGNGQGGNGGANGGGNGAANGNGGNAGGNGGGSGGSGGDAGGDTAGSGNAGGGGNAGSADAGGGAGAGDGTGSGASSDGGEAAGAGGGSAGGGNEGGGSAGGNAGNAGGDADGAGQGATDGAVGGGSGQAGEGAGVGDGAGAGDGAGPAPASDLLPVAVAVTPQGTALGWQALAASPDATIQVWRQDADGWALVATLPAAATGFVDPAPAPEASYAVRLVAEAAPSAAFPVPQAALPAPSGATPREVEIQLPRLQTIMAFAVAATLAVMSSWRSPVTLRSGQRPEAKRPPPAASLRAILAGRPACDETVLARLEVAGLGELDRLKAADRHAAAFWTGLDAVTLDALLERASFLAWPGAPAPARMMLDDIGVRSLTELARASPSALWDSLRLRTEAMGVAPLDLRAIEEWVQAAQQTLRGQTPIARDMSMQAIQPPARPPGFGVPTTA